MPRWGIIRGGKREEVPDNVVKDERWRFVRDEDKHWYLIPNRLHFTFTNLMDYKVFYELFDPYRTHLGPWNFTFTDPALDEIDKEQEEVVRDETDE
jgi:hypothetical protein